MANLCVACCHSVNGVSALHSEILKDLSLIHIYFVTIIGGNGAGKSTLFNAVAGVFYVDEGRVILDGEDMTFLPEYKRSNHLGRLFQDPLKGTAPHMTIEENLALAYLRSVRTRSPFGKMCIRDRCGSRRARRV